MARNAKLKAGRKRLEMDELENEKRITRVEESTKSAHKRIDSMEIVQKEIRDLAMSVNDLAGSVRNMCEDVCDINARVKLMEEKPSKRWDQLVGYVLAAVCSGLIGYLLSNALVK